MNNIVLVGFMGVGKGQVGRALAEHTSLYCVDCDDLIESACNMKVKKIFSHHGERFFRDFEKKTAQWLAGNVTNTIISTGGGFVNVPDIQHIGTIVHLHADFDYIIERILAHPNGEKKLKKRPLLQDMAAARKLYEERLPLYENIAAFQVDVSKKTPLEIAREIAGKLKLKEKWAGKNVGGRIL